MSDEETTSSTEQPAGLEIGRRGFLEALVSLPVVGVFFYGFLEKKAAEATRKEALLAELGVHEGGPAYIPEAISRPPSERVRLGIIGYGGEGESLVRHAGFAHPDWVEGAREAHQEDPRNKNGYAESRVVPLPALLLSDHEHIGHGCESRESCCDQTEQTGPNS